MTTRRFARRAALLAVLVAPAAARAQEPDSLARRLAAVPPRTLLRFQLRSGSWVIAPLIAQSGASVLVGDSTDAVSSVALADVSRAWKRGRATKSGAAFGAVFGALGGGFLGLLANAVCEGDCGSLGTSITIGALLGAGAGAGAGAIIGAAAPRWKPLYARADARPAPRDRTTDLTMHRGARLTGEASFMVQGGYGGLPATQFAGDATGGLGGVEAGLGFRAGRLAFGPEAALLWGASDVLSIGAMARVDLASLTRTVVPYAVAGLGGVGWESDNNQYTALTLTVGGGVMLSGGRWRVEARYQPSVQNGDAKPQLFTVAMGRRFAW